MNEQAEKISDDLICEVVGIINEEALKMIRDPDWPDDENYERRYQQAQRIITRISQAIADGMPLPGEKLRKTIWDMERIVGIQRGDTIIALSPSGIPAERKEEGE